MDSIYWIIITALLLLAAFDLINGVANDAVNFLNSAIGSKAAPVRVILTVASIGVLVGACFSGGITQKIAENEIIHTASELAQKKRQQHKYHRLPDAGGSGFTHRAGILSQVHRRSNRYFYPPAFPGI